MNRGGSYEGERGFSLVELLIVLAVVGILANIVVPVLLGALADAQASAMLGDANTIFKAADKYRLENGDYPSTASLGVRPSDLDDILQGVSFQRGDTRYRWYSSRSWHGLLMLTTGDPAALADVSAQWSGRSLYFRNLVLLYEFN